VKFIWYSGVENIVAFFTLNICETSTWKGG